MKKLPFWVWVPIALIAADLLLLVSGTAILMRQQRGHGWSVDLAGKHRIPVLGCTYWTGLSTRLVAYPMPQPGQTCVVLLR